MHQWLNFFFFTKRASFRATCSTHLPSLLFQKLHPDCPSGPYHWTTTNRKIISREEILVLWITLKLPENCLIFLSLICWFGKDVSSSAIFDRKHVRIMHMAPGWDRIRSSELQNCSAGVERKQKSLILPSPSFEYQVCIWCSFRVLVARSAFSVCVSRSRSLSQRLHHLCVQKQYRSQQTN